MKLIDKLAEDGRWSVYEIDTHGIYEDAFKDGFRAALELAAQRSDEWDHGDTEEGVTLGKLIRGLGEKEV